MKQKKNQVEEGKQVRKRWNTTEDDLLFRTVRAFPFNLHKCFMMVAEQTGRTSTAVEARWYGHVSKTPNAVAFFTASPQHISRNRKNGKGVESNSNIWRRLMAAIKNII